VGVSTRRRPPPEPVTILREEYDALIWVFDLAKQLVDAMAADDRPSRNEALDLLPDAVKKAREADTDA
jgi:hypothetical protein